MSVDIEDVLAALTEDTNAADIVIICGALIASYCDTPHQAREILRAVINQLTAHYSMDPCPCDTCVAERKKGLN